MLHLNNAEAKAVQTAASRQASPAQPQVSRARWAKPLPRVHANFIPAQSWLEYNWVDKDPEMDFVLHAIEESGMTIEQIERETERLGHKVSRYTMLGWFYKGVKRPQNCTINTVMACIGWERPWVRRA